MLETPVIKHSALGRRRSQITIRCTHDSLDAVLRDTITRAALSAAGVLNEPAPHLLVTTIEPARVTVVLRFWHHPKTAPGTTSAVIETVAAVLHTTDIAAVVTSDDLVPPLTPPPPT